MNSSTSSSEQVVSTRKLFLRILLATVVGMSIAMLCVVGFAKLNGAGSQSLMGRVLLAQDAIPKIAAEQNDLVMFFGSSMVRAGFSPREFDQGLADRGVDVTSFNFGFGGLNPIFQEYLSRRIVEKFNQENRRLSLIMIEFNPFQTTLKRRAGAVALEESYIALLASPKELLDLTLKDPERGLRMLGIRYLRDGVSAEMITTFFWGEPFQQDPPRTKLVKEEGVEDRLEVLQEELETRFAAEYPDYDDSDWYYPWRGGGTIKAERPADTVALFDEYYELTQTDFQKDNAKLRRIARSDIQDLNFDPELVDAFIATVKNLQQIADRVEIVMLPKNTKWIKNPPEAVARQEEVVAKIKQETSVPFRDYQHIDVVDDSMFSDATHLNRYYGAVKFTEYLVAEYEGILQNLSTGE